MSERCQSGHRDRGGEASGWLPTVKPLSPANSNIDVQGNDQAANITLSTIPNDVNAATKSGNSDTYVKLQVGLTKALSTDIWVFVKIDNSDDRSARSPRRPMRTRSLGRIARPVTVTRGPWCSDPAVGWRRQDLAGSAH